jgi:hypothetical protein
VKEYGWYLSGGEGEEIGGFLLGLIFLFLDFFEIKIFLFLKATDE